MNRIHVKLMLAAVLVAAPALASAQACIGVPSRDGEIGIFGSYAGVDGASQLGGDFYADITGPGSFEFGYRGGESGLDRRTYSVRGAYELYTFEPSMCAVGGILFRDNPAAGVEEQLGIPVGFGVGKTARRDVLTATLFAIPQYVWLREVNTELQDVGERVLTSNEFMGEVGVTLGWRPFYLGGGLVLSTMEDPGLRVRLGLVF